MAMKSGLTATPEVVVVDDDVAPVLDWVIRRAYKLRHK